MQLHSESVQVIALQDTDISNLVQSITLYESINGFLKGTMQILDGINFYDKIFGEYDQLIPMQVAFEHMGEQVINIFAVDGISNMKIAKSQKEYTLHVITAAEHVLRLTNINHLYEGTSHEIIGSIWAETLGEGSRLSINAPSVNSGRYIVPNISALEAINNVMSAAVDEQKTGFYLFQRIFDRGMVHMSSLASMAEDLFINADGSRFEITSNIASVSESNPNAFAAGTSNTFEVNQYKMNHTRKMAAGVWGHSINHVHLDKTKTNKFETIEQTASEITRYKLSENLYTNVSPPNAPPGPHFESHPKSIFSTIHDPTDTLAMNMKRRMSENMLKVREMSPIPFIGCGKAIKVSLGGSNQSSEEAADGDYIVADINHLFVRTGEYIEYKQNATLIREFA